MTIKNWLLKMKIASDTQWQEVKDSPEGKRGSKLLGLGILLLMTQVCFGQVVTDVASNPLVMMAIGIAQILVQGFGGVMIIFGVFILGKSWMSKDPHGRSHGWWALAGGTILMGSFSIARYVNEWWKTNIGGSDIPDIFLG